MNQDQVIFELLAIEAKAVSMLGKVPTMARAMYPDFVKAAEDHIQRIKALRKAVENQQ